jgi:hypothetical protein
MDEPPKITPELRLCLSEEVVPSNVLDKVQPNPFFPPASVITVSVKYLDV